MKCEVCGTGERREKLIRYSLDMEDRLVVVEHVPASVCDHCGETTLSPERLRRATKRPALPVLGPSPLRPVWFRFVAGPYAAGAGRASMRRTATECSGAGLRPAHPRARLGS
jgi:YgiT-type zinc finger domain-containing protein